jgi:hypothetical protein
MMWNLMKGQDDCSRFRTVLEDSATAHPDARTVEELTADLPPATAAHFHACPDCEQAARELLAAREIVRQVSPPASESAPWFTERVLAAIAVREKELEEAAGTWLVVPRFASRLALASAALLLIASTWLYERPSAEKMNPPAAVATPEYLFEAPPPSMNQDDVLISMAERNP